MRFTLVALLLFGFFVPGAFCQDTLPKFTAVIKENGKVLISWRNTYPVVNQISIQRSSDSLRNFTTLLTVPDPTIPENGFVDSKGQGTHMYYRLFILLGNSKYLFSKSRRAIPEFVAKSQKPVTEDEELNLRRMDNQRIYFAQENNARSKPTVTVPGKINAISDVKAEKTIYIKRQDSLIAQLSGKSFIRFRDSILSKTKDTMLFVQLDTVLIKTFIPPVKEVKEAYKVSSFVYTAKDGNVNIALPDAARKKYQVKFFEQDSTPLLELKEIKDTLLIVDKTNFIHSGWFRFELYEEGKLKEKNKLFIPRDF
ncbi:MAG: hypothetical protein C5B59_17605 [Bacteroidetes bacterium]|nr:MAG: hypothetical protein C5B59_17605 [Bacteroidota bacterium]